MKPVSAFITCLLLALPAVLAAQRPAALVRQELEQAAREVPQLAELLALKPGGTVADVGSGGGAMAVVFARWLRSGGRVYATDVREAQLAEIREAVAREGLTRDPQDIGASLLAALKPGGRLAIMDFPPDPGSSVPEGVPANRGGHGIPA